MTTAVTTPQGVAQQSAGQQTSTIASSSDFSTALLEELGLPVTAANVGALNAWQAAEGQWTASGEWNPTSNHNPLNIEGGGQTHDAGGGNLISIWPDWTTGVANTAAYIHQRTPGIVRVLQTGAASPPLLSAAVTQSGWGTQPFGNGSTASQGGTGGPQDVTLTGKYTGGLPNPIDPGQVAGAVTTGAADLIPGLGAVKSTASFLSFLLSVRFLEMLGGVLLIGLGTAVFLSSTKPGQEAISVGALAAVA